MAGARGPVPKRSTQRRRRNEPEGGPVDHAPGATEVPVPKANSKWHPIAKRWFESLAVSGQAVYYQPSDWATAELVAESMSRDLKPQPIGVNEETGQAVMAVIPLKGASLAAYLKAFAALVVTEGDRRRARIELDPPKGGDGDGDVAGVSWLDEARRARESG